VRVLVTGGRGMLGHAVAHVFGEIAQVMALGHEELDITDDRAVMDRVLGLSPDLIVNCAAYTDVDGAEEARGEAFKVNSQGPGNLARAARTAGARLVHVSTDYVFDGEGKRPYKEDDPRAPINAYGMSKAEGEDRVMAEGRDFIIVRTSWLFGPNGKNFVSTILDLSRKVQELRVVDDQRGSPTYTFHLARALLNLALRDASGVYHFSSSGECTWYEFAREILALSGINDCKVVPVAAKEFPRPARRPRYSVLDTRRYRMLTGTEPPSWKEGLRDYLLILSEERS